MSNLIYLSVPGLRRCDISGATPQLRSWADQGALHDLTPTFPCVTSCLQASMFTGVGPRGHGVIANGFYDRSRREVEFWVGRNNRIQAPQIWEELKRRGMTSAVWHAQNIKDAAADFIVTPEPIHEPNGATKLWCYSKPDGLYAELLANFGHFPLQHYWGPLSNIESTKWILRAAAWLHKRNAPNFHWIYLPHLDYAMQKFGPNSPQARQSLIELDRAIAEFAAFILGQTHAIQGEPNVILSKPSVILSKPSVILSDAKDLNPPVFLVAGEYAMTEVNAGILPNRILRQAGMLAVREENGREVIDFPRTPAFAMVDHQLAHVFVQDDAGREMRSKQVAELFRGVPGIAGVFAGSERTQIGLDHPLSGDVILISDDDRWFAYYWWLDDAVAPSFARTVDIHRKPGYDPVELFFDPSTKGIPLNAELVKGSHGVPATQARHRTALICSQPSRALDARNELRDTDLKNICLELLQAS